MTIKEDDVNRLTELVRRVVRRSQAPDPTDVAAEVSKEIPDEGLREALDEALVIVVRTVVSRMRGHVEDPESTDPGGDLVVPDAHLLGVAPGVGPSKATAIRHAWRARLHERIAVGADRGGWRFLADCSAEDLDYAAALRFEHSARTRATGEKLAELANAVRAAGVERVADLPDLAQRLA